MASKEVPDLTHNGGLDLATTEIHVVTNVVRDGGGALISHGDSRRASLAEILALLAFASVAEFRAGTVAGKVLAPKNVWDAAAYVALADAATVALDFALMINGAVTLGGNRTLGLPANMKEGQTGLIVITQDGTGGRTLAYNAAWKFAAAIAPTLSIGAGKRDLLFYEVLPGGATVFGNLIQDV
jgi:hypothetical protein